MRACTTHAVTGPAGSLGNSMHGSDHSITATTSAVPTIRRHANAALAGTFVPRRARSQRV